MKNICINNERSNNKVNIIYIISYSKKASKKKEQKNMS